MVARALVWLGTKTDRLEDMRAFWQGLLGSDPTVDTSERVVFHLPSGDQVEVFGPADADHRHFTTGPVPGILVDEMGAAITRLETLGAELLPPAPTGHGDVHTMHFRAPDGNVYTVTERTTAPTGLPPLAAENFTCAVCDLAYPAVTVAAALTAIEHQPGQLRATALTIPDGVLRTRPDPGTWSALEYLCHLRDVFASAAIRLHRIRTEDHPLLEPLFNNLRAERFSYNKRELLPILDELTDNARGFCQEVRRTPPGDWSRRASRLPGEVRTARWLVRQTMHEGMHHERDIREVAHRATAGS